MFLARGGLIGPAVCRRIPIEREFRVTVPGGGSYMYSAMADDGMGRGLQWGGWNGCDAETLGVFLQLARRADVVIDVGAYTGVYSLTACAVNPVCKVMSFEPTPSTYCRCVKNVDLNGWAGRCHVRREAVCDCVGRTAFHVPDYTLPPSASLNPKGFRGLTGTVIEVETTTIDNAVGVDDRVDLVKIDVEGFEDKVLLGMNGVLRTSKPDLVIECNVDGPYKAVQAILASHSYLFYHLRKGGPELVETIRPDPREKDRNFLCTVRGLPR
jgi:FkbM family methyltransferase